MYSYYQIVLFMSNYLDINICRCYVCFMKGESYVFDLRISYGHTFFLISCCAYNTNVITIGVDICYIKSKALVISLTGAFLFVITTYV